MHVTWSCVHVCVCVTAGRACVYLVLLVVCEAGELPELQLDSGNLSNRAVGGPAGGVGGALPDVHVRVRDLRRGLEGRHQPRANVLLKDGETRELA